MKKLKNEKALIKKAIQVGMNYAERRGAAKFEATDSVHVKVEYVYRLLVHDKVIQPLPEEKVNEKTMGHKLAMWLSHQLPKDHPLLK